MKKTVLALLVVVLAICSVRAQMVSYHLQQSFTVAQLDSFLAASGFTLPVQPQYPIEVYQVIYQTPYKHIDSLVNASGIVVFPKNRECASALGCYAHGTFTRRDQVPSYVGPERPIGFFFAGVGGVVTAMPDELGLGDSDSNILIHPYINAFHSGHASVNLMRAARQLADTLSIALNGEVVLTGYSQGGYTTMATNKLIQENYSTEFNVVASAPMSGSYDLKKTMVDVMLDTFPYSVPSYLPYLLLGYHSVYPALRQKYPTPSDVFKHPYDSILPPMYYSKNFSTNDINAFCTPVPRDMIKDSVLLEFVSDTNNVLRQILAENDLLGWAPQNTVKISYCTGDDQVSYLNSVRADSAWRANGAPSIQIQDFGNLTHAGCVQPALTSTAFYLLTKITPCNTGIHQTEDIAFRFSPNPTTGQITVVKQEGFYELFVFNVNGQQVYRGTLIENSAQIDLNFLHAGFYILELRKNTGISARKKLVVSNGL